MLGGSGVRERGRLPAVPVMRARWAAVIALGAGLIGAPAFPRIGWWPLMFVSIAGLSLAVHGRRARTGAWLGYLYGAAFFVPLLHWTGVYVGPFPWLLLAFAEAGFTAALGAALTALQRLRLPAFWVGCAWVLQEALRDRLPFGGFPWGRLAFSQSDSPFRWFARLGGAPLTSFAVAVTAGALWSAAERLRADRGMRRGAVGALTVAAAMCAFAIALTALRPAAGATERTTALRIAVVQGSVPDRGLAFEDRAREVLDNHIAQTDKLAADISAGRVARPDLVIWPENASDVDPFEDLTAFQDIDAAVKRVGVPVLVGAILQGPGDKRRNAGILWSPTSGPGAQYVKRHPVPFGEYIPLRSIAKVFSSDVNLVTQDMVGGRGNGLVRGGPVPIGDVICFEVAYDSLVRSSVRAGAQLVVVQTNNATFGHTSETYQQLAMAKLRAIETARTVVQSATTGKSAIIAPDGAIVAESGALFTPDVLVSSIPLETGRTLAVRLGAGPEYGLALVAIAGMVYCALPWLRRRISRPRVAQTDSTNDEREVVTT